MLILACAANVDSAATLIGNPQNMLIGTTLRLSFGGYALEEAAGPMLFGLLATLAICAGYGDGGSAAKRSRRAEGIAATGPLALHL